MQDVRAGFTENAIREAHAEILILQRHTLISHTSHSISHLS